MQQNGKIERGNLPTYREQVLKTRDDMFSFRGLTYIVAGADRIPGVSGQLTQLLISNGANVVTCGPKPSGDELVALCSQINGGRSIFMRGDCTDGGFCDEVARRAITEFGAIHGLAALGVVAPKDDGSIRQVEFAKVMDTIRTNLGIVWRMTSSVLGQFETQNLGRIVLANSRSANGYAGQWGYSLSKGLVTTFTAKMLEFAGMNILTNAIRLGPTPNHGQSWQERDCQYPNGRRGLAAATPYGRMITDAQAAWHFAILLHPSCLFCGQEIVLDGGEEAAGTIFRTANFIAEAEFLYGALEQARR